MPDLIKEFNDYRQKMNEVILSKNNLVMKRLWNLNTNTSDSTHKKSSIILGRITETVTP
jgi:hypothetical protein